jgi:hypothetical protein
MARTVPLRAFLRSASGVVPNRVLGSMGKVLDEVGMGRKYPILLLF